MRVALWRAMHVQVDPPPHVLDDEISLRLATPDDGWRRRPDMDPHATSGFRAAVVARARLIEDLVTEQADRGVTQYVTEEATAATLRQIAGLAPGSTLAMTFLLQDELLDAADRPGLRASKKGAQAAGTPFVSFHTPQDMLALAHASGFDDARHMPGASLAERYFAGRTDGLRPSSGEDLLLATT
nr:class I SAM-dependent methyltransferase [Streptomyces sp. PSAA01]